jgi:hypothetical protein
MPYPRIFVSHSAKDELASRTLDAIQAKLDYRSGGQFDVFIDRERLEGGQKWRNVLFAQMYRAHGAVILFSEPVFDSTFVPTEVSILGSRPYLDADFLLIPVLLGGVTPARVEEKFPAVRLSETQMVGGGDPAAVAEEVRRLLLPLVPKHSAQTPLNRLEVMIADLLKDVPQAALSGAAEALNADPGAWQPDAGLPSQLARELWQADIIDAGAVIGETLRGHLDDEKARRLVELLAPSWVDPCMAEAIPEVAKGEPERRTLAVNGKLTFTAHMLVRRACCRAPDSSWPVATLTGAWDDDATESLRREIASALKSALKMDVGESDALLHHVLKRREQGPRHEPIFVAFIEPTPPPDVLAELRASFPTVTFFLLTGERLPEQDEAGECYFQPLEPGLPEGREEGAYYDYRTALTIAGVKAPTL